MRWQIFFRFSVAVVLQAWILSFTTPSNALQLESIQGHWTLEEEFVVSVFSFLPTAALSKNQSTFVSQKCAEDSRLLLKALLNRTEWALSMFQASGKLPVDVSTNNFLIAGANGALDEPGHFDQCITSKPNSGDFEGKYCSVFLSAIPVTQSLLDEKGPESYKQSRDGEIFKPPTMTVVTKKRHIFAHENPTDLIIGFCMPSSCTASDLQVAITHGIGRTSLQLEKQQKPSNLYSLTTATHEGYCHTESKIQEQSSLNWLSISFLTIVVVIVGSVLTSTVYELWESRFPVAHKDKTSSKLMKTPSTPVKVLQCFSAVRNIKEWLSVKTATVDEITCLHGLRVVSLMVTLFIHTSEVVCFLSRPINQEKIFQLASKLIWFPFMNGGVVMENCLLIGGILTCTSLLKDLDRGRFKLSRFYFHRFLRLTPLYSMTLFFVAALAGRLGSGPNWNTVQYQSEDCRTYWWSHLLYINNIFPSDLTFCMPDTWYSAVDMQLFILSPFFIFPLWRWPRKIGPTLVLLGLSASTFYTMIIHLNWNIPLVVVMTRASMRKQLPKYFQYYYTRTFNRIPAYLVGIMLGWILHRTKNSKILIKKITLIISWVLSGLTLAMIIYGPYPYVDENTAPIMNPMFELVYGAFHRTLWSTTLAFIIFLCFHGYGGKLNEFLSSKMFVPISRLSYCIYMVNFTLISAYVSYFRVPFNVNTLNLIIAYLGMMTFTLILSVLLCIFVEMPFRNLEKILFHSTYPIALEKNSNASFPFAKETILKGSKEY